MSTKIYTAWRVPQRRLNEFLDLVDPQIFASVIKDTERMMDIVLPEAVDAERKRRYPNGWRAGITQERVDRVICCEKALELAQQARQKGIWQLSLDCGFNVWLYRTRAYVIPWGPLSYYEKLAVPEWAEDYSYWNNSDRPDTISRQAWEARARTWDKVALDDWDGHRLVHSVVDMDRSGTGWSRIHWHFLTEGRGDGA